MDEIVVIGGGGHAKVLISILLKTPWEVLGYTDVRDKGALLAVPHLGDDSILPELLASHRGCCAALGVGKVDTSPRRSRLQQQAESLGFVFPVIVSPAAVVNAEVELGPGTAVFDGAVINPGTVASRGCIVNTNSTLEHDCHLGDDVHIAPGATVSGGVSIGSHCLIGAGAIVVQGVSICRDCLIGAGSTVIRDIATPGKYAGCPVRRIG